MNDREQEIARLRSRINSLRLLVMDAAGTGPMGPVNGPSSLCMQSARSGELEAAEKQLRRLLAEQPTP